MPAPERFQDADSDGRILWLLFSGLILMLAGAIIEVQTLPLFPIGVKLNVLILSCGFGMVFGAIEPYGKRWAMIGAWTGGILVANWCLIERVSLLPLFGFLGFFQFFRFAIRMYQRFAD